MLSQDEIQHIMQIENPEREKNNLGSFAKLCFLYRQISRAHFV